MSREISWGSSQARSADGQAGSPPYILAAFVEKVFLPLEATGASHNYRWQCRRAVQAFTGFLGRLALLSDLTVCQVKRFTEWLPGNEPESQHRILCNRLRSIWRYAAMIGLAEPIDDLSARPQEKKPRPPKVRKKPLPVKPVMEPGTVSHFFETVYLPQRLVGASKVCIDDYRRKIRQFDQFAGAPVLLSDLSDQLLAAFLNDRVDAGLRKVTVNQCRAHVLAVWRLAFEQGHVEHQPSIRKLREAHDEPDAWTEDEFRLILSKCDSLDARRPVGGLPASALMRAVLLLAYWTGLRRGTLWKLKWDDVDLRERWVTVPGDLMKSNRGKKYRIGLDAEEALEGIWIAGAETVLPKIGWQRFYADFDRLLDAAGIQPSRRRVMTKLHKVRRTTATMVASRQGLNAASTLLGHSSQQITLRYIDPSQQPGNDMTVVLPDLSAKKDQGGAA